MIIYCLAWSPKKGEATFTRTFDSEEEREAFRKRIAYEAKTIRTWENTYCL